MVVLLALGPAEVPDTFYTNGPTRDRQVGEKELRIAIQPVDPPA
jgi:hypothetical protein